MPTNLPLELWCIILREVVYIRGALETIMTTHFEWLEWRYDEKQKYVESLNDRLSLVQVSKTWHSLALGLLYEDIRLQSFDTIMILYASLYESAQTRSNSHLGYGRWTKRFDLIYDDGPGLTESSFYSLITHFPNLRILRADHIPRLVIHRLPKLRYMDMEPDAPCYNPPTILVLDGSHNIPTNLDTLRLVHSFECKYTFPNLTSLEISFIREVVPRSLKDYFFPNIQHLTLSKIRRDDFPAIEAFLSRYGQQLLSLYIDPPYPGILQLLCKTPNLRELIFTLNYGVVDYDWFPMDSHFPSVQQIGISDQFPNWFEQLQDSFFFTRFPNVKCIRMFQDVFAHAQRLTAMFRTWYQDGRLAGVRYEDAERNDLSDVLDKVLGNQVGDTSETT